MEYTTLPRVLEKLSGRFIDLNIDGKKKSNKVSTLDAD